MTCSKSLVYFTINVHFASCDLAVAKDCLIRVAKLVLVSRST